MANICRYAEGTGRNQYKCPILGKPCLFQHWCTITKSYQLTSTATKCSAKLKADNKK